MCWRKEAQKSTKYLYILSNNNCLHRHPVSYELIVFICNLYKQYMV